MKITQSTLDYAREVLSAHRIHSEKAPNNKEQQAYFDGLRDMLEIILTEGYTREVPA